MRRSLFWSAFSAIQTGDMVLVDSSPSVIGVGMSELPKPSAVQWIHADIGNVGRCLHVGVVVPIETATSAGTMTPFGRKTPG